MYGYLRGIVQHKKCPVKVSIKVVEADKQKMFDNFHATRSEALRNKHSPEAQTSTTNDAEVGSSLPPLLYKDEPTGEGWITFDQPICYLYAGKGPYVARDLMQFPVSHPNDGCIDVVIQEVVSGPLFWVPISILTDIRKPGPAKRDDKHD